MASLVFGNDLLVLRAFASLANAAPGSTNYNYHKSYIATYFQDPLAYNKALNGVFKGWSDKQLGDLMLANLELTSIFTSAQAEAYIKGNAGDRVGAVLNLADLLANYNGTDAKLIVARDELNAKIDFAFTYSATNAAQTNFPDSFATPTFTLTTGFDNLTGTASAENFVARTLGNAQTLNDGDVINGEGGIDTLFADLNAQATAITPRLTGIETVVVRAQSTTGDATNGNNTSSNGFVNLVQIDAQRSLAVDVADKVTAATGVTRWESNNSRSDVVIEDVRIGNSQKTSDVTIAFVESDPGNVDFGVYFDQQSLRNASTGSTSLTINLMDTGAAGVPATAATPLLNNPYDQFKLAINGVLTTLQLDKTAVKAADTYAQLLEVFKTATAGSGVTVSLGGNFTITDPLSGKAVTGQSIIITGGANNVITAPEGSGWFNTTGASVPASSNIYTTFTTGATSVTELVTSKVILDDVGRSNLGGDLVIGGMSTGDTSNYSIYRGVERFEIEVQDNSKLQTINSTNNALREVVITSGATSRTVADAYTTTVTNEGDLVVNGDAATNLALTDTSTQIRGQSYAVPAAGVQSTGNNQLPGVENNSPVGVHHGASATGFTDVRLIDASAFKGKLGFTAAITQDAIAKYETLIDTAPAAPAADVAGNGNVNFGVRGANFIYTGGNDNDTMTVTIDGATAGSRSTVVSGQSDFTFAFNGGAGDDALTVTVINSALAGNQQAWYNNQKLNANIAIGAGDGNDTIRTPGAGDVIIDAGTGNDTVYTDNTGALGVNANSVGASNVAEKAYADAAAAELASALAARVLDNTNGFVLHEQLADGTQVTAAAVAAALDTLDLATAPSFPTAAITHATINTAIDTAWTAGALSFAQVQALKTAYNTATTVALTAASNDTLAAKAFTEVAVAGNLTAGEFAAGNTLLATYITAAKAAAAAATAADVNEAYQTGLLNVTQAAVITAQQAVTQVRNVGDANAAGSQVVLDALNALKGAVAVGSTDAAVVTALRAAVNAGAISGPQATTLFGNAVASVGTVDANELATFTQTLTPLITAAAATNTTNLATLATAKANDTTAINTVGNLLATSTVGEAFGDDVPNQSAVAGDAVGVSETATALTAARTALTNANTELAAAQAIETALISLKAAVNVGTNDTALLDALTVAGNTVAAEVAKAVAANAGTTVTNVLLGAEQTALETIASAGAQNIANAVDATEEKLFETGFDNAATNGPVGANYVDKQIALNRVVIDALAQVVTDKTAIVTATQKAATEAAAAAASGQGSFTVNGDKATFVFNTADQTSTYNRVTSDERNLADLKSDANNSNNFFNVTLKVTYKGIDSSVTVAGTNFKTTDLEINQSIKQAINSDAVLSKLLLATDGPANSLVVTSLIDGTHVTGNLAVSITTPTTVTTADLAGAAAAYGLAAGATEAQVLAVINAAKTAFDTKGDYVTQFAEAGAAAGDTLLVGANSTSSSDNTITLGTGNDVLVLGTTVGPDSISSSNEKIIYSGLFGNDTVVNFAATGLGIDVLDFTALNGRGNVALNSLSLDKSIVIAAPTAVGATPLTAAQIAALFTDSATAISHVYVAVDSTNIGSVWQVADAAGTAAGNVVATLVGSIDLADTAWGTLTAANFA